MALRSRSSSHHSVTDHALFGSPSSPVQEPHQQNSEKPSSSLEADREREKVSNKRILYQPGYNANDYDFSAVSDRTLAEIYCTGNVDYEVYQLSLVRTNGQCHPFTALRAGSERSEGMTLLNLVVKFHDLLGVSRAPSDIIIGQMNHLHQEIWQKGEQNGRERLQNYYAGGHQ
jgi:hypothetical protein